MRIAQIDIYQVDLPVKGGVYRLSGGREYHAFDASIARVTSDDGSTGWGESTPFGSTYIASHAKGTRAALEILAPSIIGLDPRHHDRIQDRLEETLSGHRDARTALDVACWDLTAKTAGVPLCDLAGGRIPGPVPIISSIGSNDPEKMRANVRAHRNAGYSGHSIKIGANEVEGGPALDAERLRACLADRKPGEWFLADANNGMRPEEALRMLSLLPDGLDFVLEAPCPSLKETLSVRSRCKIPIMLDELIQTEADLIEAIAADACDGVGLKVSKQGGITAILRQREIARAAGLTMSIQDTTGSEIAFAAILHVAQSTPRKFLCCALDPRMMINASAAAFDAPVKNGGVEAPSLPGLGVEPKMNVLGDPVATYN